MSEAARILIHVQHLLGTGHLRRMATIAAALTAQGARVVLMSGGTPVTGLEIGQAEFVQLAPARAADARFKTLVHADGAPVDDTWRTARAAEVCKILTRVAPHVLLIEHFPFGRRLLEFELLPLLALARARIPRPVIVSSIRDVLAFKPDPIKRRQMIDRATTMFDHVLFHGDARLLPLAASLPEADALGARCVETGYVALPASRSAPGDEGMDEIIVSAGGGAVGRRLLDCAVAARALSRARGRTWRILTAETGLAPRQEAGLVVEGNRADFPSLLARAQLSVSQAGYNTIVDLLNARARAVLVPFAEHHETEQSQRAQALAAHGLATCLAEDAVTPASLAAAIDAAIARPRPTHAIRLDGAARTAASIMKWGAR